MVLVGGLCFIGVGRINEVLDWDTPLVLQALIGTAVITVVEFASGCVLNLWLGLNIWDYSDLPLNVLGQVCLLYAVLWYFLALPVIVVDDYLRWRLCGGSWPRLPAVPKETGLRDSQARRNFLVSPRLQHGSFAGLRFLRSRILHLLEQAPQGHPADTELGRGARLVAVTGFQCRKHALPIADRSGGCPPLSA